MLFVKIFTDIKHLPLIIAISGTPSSTFDNDSGLIVVLTIADILAERGNWTHHAGGNQAYASAKKDNHYRLDDSG
jgi:hypothetical protein